MGAYRRFEATASTGGSASVDVTLQLSNVDSVSSNPLNPLWLIRSVFAKFTTGGGAATYDVRLGETSGWTNDAQDERYANTATAIADRVKDVISATPIETDANGRIYLRLEANAGSGHSIEYTVDLEAVPGS